MAKKNSKSKKDSNSTAQGKTQKPKSPRSKTREVSVADLKFLIPPDVKTLWIDRMTVTRRSDGIATLGFETAVEEAEIRIQVARFKTTESHLKRIIDVLCQAADHYPKKKSKK